MSEPKYDITKKILSGKLNRRQMMQALGAAGLVATTQFGTKAMAAENARILTWSGYDVPEMYPGMDPERLEFSIGDDAESMLQKIRAGFESDIAHPCTSDPIRWHRAGVIQPLDISRLEHWDNVFDSMKQLPTTYFEGKHWFAPCEFGDTTIIYNQDKLDWVESGKTSINMLYDDRLEGKVGMLDSAADSLYVLMIGLGIDVTNMESITMQDIDRVYAALEKLRPNLRVVSADPTTLEQAIMDGEVDAMIAWNESAWNTGMRMLTPKEGTLTWCCGAVIPKSANLDVAYEVINAMQSPECSRFMLEDYGYGHVNKVGYDAISTEAKNERGLALDPVAHLANGNFSDNPTPEITDYIEQRWAEFTAGVI
tara:strand:- start:6 stop:1109 length:1104 start_codon:yes stop_codon:yes gene_type:complete